MKKILKAKHLLTIVVNKSQVTDITTAIQKIDNLLQKLEYDYKDTITISDEELKNPIGAALRLISDSIDETEDVMDEKTIEGQKMIDVLKKQLVEAFDSWNLKESALKSITLLKDRDTSNDVFTFLNSMWLSDCTRGYRTSLYNLHRKIFISKMQHVLNKFEKQIARFKIHRLKEVFDDLNNIRYHITCC